MYLSHYGLKLKPFQITVDPRFLWLSEKHKEALAALKYGIVENKGFVLLTGEVGTGKTLLIKRLEELLDIDTLSAAVPYPELTTLDFFKLLGISFGFKNPFRTKAEFLIQLKEFLLSAYQKDKQVLLIVDESQLLSNRLLDEIRLLSNIELHDRKLINILFVGQGEFLDVLSEQRNRAVAQRIAIRFNLEPLSEKEVSAFISHRLTVAGTSKKVFTASAIREVYEFSGGIPRLINVICDHALLTGYAQDKKRVDGKIVKECASELKIPVKNKQDEMKLREKADKIKHDIITKLHHQKKTDPQVVKEYSEFELPPYPDLVVEKEKTIVDMPMESSTVDESEPYLNYVDHSDSVIEPPVNKRETVRNRVEPPMKPADQAKRKTTSLSVLAACLATILIVGFGYIFFGIKSEDVPKWSIQENLPPNEISEPFNGTKSDISDNDIQDEIKRIDDGIEASPVQPTSSVAVRKRRPQFDDKTKTPQTDISQKNGNYPLKIIVYFDLNSNEVSEDGIRALDRFVEYMKLFPKRSVYVKGYTDSKGPRSYNISISQFRANIVKSYLTGKGILPSNIQTFAFGAENPLASNETLKGRRLNRRVEVEIAVPAKIEKKAIE